MSRHPAAESALIAGCVEPSDAPAKGLDEQNLADAPMRGRGNKSCLVEYKGPKVQVGGFVWKQFLQRAPSPQKQTRACAAVHGSRSGGSEVARLLPDPQDNEDEAGRRRARHNRLLAEHFFDNGKGNKAPGVHGTLWAAYNGVTELVDHRATTQTDDRRLDAIWFGDGYLTKARAFIAIQPTTVCRCLCCFAKQRLAAK